MVAFSPASASGEASIKTVVWSDTGPPHGKPFALFGVTVTVRKIGPESLLEAIYCAFKDVAFTRVPLPPVFVHWTETKSVAVADKLAVPSWQIVVSGPASTVGSFTIVKIIKSVASAHSTWVASRVSLIVPSLISPTLGK